MVNRCLPPSPDSSRLSPAAPVTVGYRSWLRELADALEGLEVHAGDGTSLPADEGFRLLLARTRKVHDRGATIFFVGNGASASMASHIAADLGKNGGVKTMVFTDPALITALANDDGVDEMFARPLCRLATPGDTLVTISSSGQSPNVCRAARRAAEIGVDTVTFSAMHADNRLRRLGNLNFYVPAATYGLAESAHAALLHMWVDRVQATPRPATTCR